MIKLEFYWTNLRYALPIWICNNDPKMFHFNFYAKKSIITLAFLSFFRCWFMPIFLLYRKQRERNGSWRFSRWRTTHICSTRPNRVHNRTWTEQHQWNRGYWRCMVSRWLQLWRKRWQNRISEVSWKWLGASKNYNNTKTNHNTQTNNNHDCNHDYNHNHNHNQNRNRKTRSQRFGTRSSWTLDPFDAL